MWEKYLIVSDECSIALKFHFIYKKVIIGGWLKDRQLMEQILNIYFGKRNLTPILNSANKVRYEFVWHEKAFRKCFKKLQKDLLVQEVLVHGRLMT